MAATPERARAAKRVNGAGQTRRRAKPSAISVTIGRTIEMTSETKRSRKSATAASPVSADSLEVLELAFTRCEVHAGADASASCPHDPGWICAGCGTLVCADHARAERRTRADDALPCGDCGAVVLDLRSAAVDVVLDARLRRAPLAKPVTAGGIDR